MARVVPDGWDTLDQAGPQRREIDTLEVLKRQLPDDYTVYHSVHWTNVEGAHAIYGEIDFVVVNRAGDLAVIEQKSGLLTETEDGLAKVHGKSVKLVQAQMAHTVEGLRSKLARTLNGHSVMIEHLLYCPDHIVRNPTTAGITPERIVDERNRSALARTIQRILPPGERQPIATRVHRFLQDIIQLETDVSALVGEARTLVTRVSGGLSHWARQLDMTPYRLRVTGTAGSGKTQLALAEYNDAIEAGRRPLYVCFNRPLADHIAHIAPPGGLVCTFHMLCDQMLRHLGHTTDFSQPGAFDDLIARAGAVSVPDAFMFDTVIVDEGQDFAPAWADLVVRHGKADARVLWLEDPMQNLYGYPPAELPGWVRLHAQSNYRSPRPVVRWLQPYLPADIHIDASAPITGSDVEILTYSDEPSLLHAVKEAIRLCYSDGFRESDLAVLSYRGRNQSALFGHERLGPHVLRSFTGEYDLLGQPVQKPGNVLLESVYRFKGQSAPAVVFAEIDFEALDERVVRRLFVGATRARMKLVLVVSERAAKVLQGN